MKIDEVFESAAEEKKFYLREIRKCKDPIYFISNYIYITTPKTKEGASKFNLWDFQKDCIKYFEENRFNVVLKSRQIGMSTLVSSYILWLMIFHKNRNILVVSIKREDSAELIDKIKYAYQHLPEWIKKIAKPKSDNVHTFELDNFSKVTASSTTKNMGRGKALTHLLIDEAAFIDGLDEAWKSVWPTISVNGSVIVFSTPDGQGNFFYELYTGAINKEPDTLGFDFNPIKLDWTVDPTRDEQWYKTTLGGMTKRQFAQEFGCSFLLSGDTVIDPEDIQRIKQSVCNPEAYMGLSRKMWIWKDVDSYREYCISCDVARGDGEDFSTFTIIDLNSFEVVASYKDKIKTDQFAEMLYDVGELYNKALLVVENNNHGWAVLQKLISMKYPNLFWTDKKTMEIIEGFIDETRTDISPGFPTTPKTRNMIITTLEESIRNKKLQLYCSRIVEEMEHFIWEKGRPQAKRGKNDDLIMALAIGCFIKEITFSKLIKTTAINKMFLKTFSSVKRQSTISVPGDFGYNIRNSIMGKENTIYTTRYGVLSDNDTRELLGRDKKKEEAPPKSTKHFNPFVKI